ncbi:MAG: protein phosphatase 2C domain-containing protein [Methanolinea sp.]|jgi:protein phosphatase|nr:protein phosphatase 2C domain-containing protein [Methanolinea sp.]
METVRKGCGNMIITCSRTERGIRERNEDACGIFSIPSPAGTLILLAVADGLGGHPAGEVASALAVRALVESVSLSAKSLVVQDGPSLQQILATGFSHANIRVLRYPEEDPACRGMGTTLVAALLSEGGEGVCGNVGDSRAYLVGRTIRRITRDHSEVQELVERGLIAADAAELHPLKNIVTRIIGRKDDVPDFYPVSLDGDCLILCSDGLTDGVSEREIHALVTTTDFAGLCEALVAAARGRSRDNITVVAAWRA